MKGVAHRMLPHSRKRIPLATSLLSAGSAFEVSDDHQMIDVAEIVTNGRDGFLAMIVTGDSMPGIDSGSIVFIDTYAQPRNGDVVAHSINGKTGVKTFKSSSRGLYLVPRNERYEPREVKATDTLHIIGVVSWVLRRVALCFPAFAVLEIL